MQRVKCSFIKAYIENNILKLRATFKHYFPQKKTAVEHGDLTLFDAWRGWFYLREYTSFRDVFILNKLNPLIGQNST